MSLTPGPARKPPALRSRRNKAPTAQEFGPVTEIPDPPDGLHELVLEQWIGLWESDIVRYYTDTDMPALRRLFALRSLSLKLNREAEANPYVAGSKDNVVANPLFAKAEAVDRKVLDLEDRFGLNPKARLGLGVVLGQAADAEKRHPGLYGPGTPDVAAAGEEGSPAHADPRLALVAAAQPDPRAGGGDVDGGEPRP